MTLTMSATILSNSRKSSKISWVDGYNNLFGNEEKTFFVCQEILQDILKNNEVFLSDDLVSQLFWLTKRKGL